MLQISAFFSHECDDCCVAGECAKENMNDTLKYSKGRGIINFSYKQPFLTGISYVAGMIKY